MSDAANIVNNLLETGEDVDWTPQPGDPDMPDPEAATDAAAEVLNSEGLKREFRKAFKGAFQQPEIEESDYFVVETSHHDTSIVPASVVDPGPVPPQPGGAYEDPAYDAYHEYLNHFEEYIEGGDVVSVERKHGFVYRTAAPGYMDSSPWGAAETEEEAMSDLIEYYGNDNFGEDEGEEL